MIDARRSTAFTRFDGNLAGLPVPSPVDRITSPTRLERWADCPHRHLVEDLLRAAPVENPEDNLMITPLDKGSLVHDALEHFLVDVLDRPAAERRPARRAVDRRPTTALLQEIGGAFCDQYEAKGLVGRPIFWTRDRRRILADLDATLAVDSAPPRRAPAPRPLAAELGFGFDRRLARRRSRCTLPDGRTLRVRGRIDRVDITADGTIHVVDYKTGSLRDGYERSAEDDPVARRHQAPAPALRPGRPARREGPDRAGARRVLVRHHARAVRPRAATTSPTRCSSAPSRCSA